MITNCFILISSLLSPICAAEVSQASTLPDELKIFSQSAVLLITGVRNQDRNALSDAAEGFSSILSAELSPEDYDVNERNPGDFVKPKMIFNEQYCDLLKKKDFGLVSVDELDQLRNALSATIPAVDILNGGVASGGLISLNLAGQDAISVVLACSDGNNIDASVSYHEGTFSFLPLHNKDICFIIFELGSNEAPFNITIENKGTESISFTLAIQ